MNFFTKLFKSFTDIKAYRYFAVEPFGKALKFLILVSLLFSLVAVIPVILEFNRGVNQASNLFAETPIDFSLRNGELSVNVDMPYHQTHDGGTTIIDTTGGTDASVLDDYSQAVFISAHKVLIKDGDSIAEISFEAMPNISLSTSFLSTFLRYFKWAIPFIIIFNFIVTLAIRLVQALVIAVAAIIIAAVLKAGLSFGGVLSMAIYSLTLPSILYIIHSWLPFRISSLYFNIIFFTVAGLFMVPALMDIAKNREHAIETEPEVEPEIEPETESTELIE